MNFGEKALQVLKTVAPTLALGALGPFGPLAAAAIHAALGTDPGDPKAAETALLNATPDQLLALKKADNDFQTQMKSLEISEEKLAFDDTASARGREMVVRDWTPQVLAYSIILGWFVLEGLIMYFGQPKNVDGVVLGRILGTLENAVMLILGYYYGTSVGAAKPVSPDKGTK
jgi:hypothetical protein